MGLKFKCIHTYPTESKVKVPTKKNLSTPHPTQHDLKFCKHFLCDLPKHLGRKFMQNFILLPIFLVLLSCRPSRPGLTLCCCAARRDNPPLVNHIPEHRVRHYPHHLRQSACR